MMTKIFVAQDLELKNWTSIPNRLILDELLKSDEVRLYCYLKSRPSNWQYNSGHIRKLFGWSKNKASSVMSSLRKSGWIAMEQEKANNGKFGSNVRCLVLTEPVRTENQPHPKITGNGENCTTETPYHGKTVSRENNDLNNIELSNKSDFIKKTLSFQEFREYLAKKEFQFEIDSGLCGFSVGTKFRIKATGYIYSTTKKTDISSEDAKAIWEMLFKKQAKCLEVISKLEAQNVPNS